MALQNPTPAQHDDIEAFLDRHLSPNGLRCVGFMPMPGRMRQEFHEDNVAAAAAIRRLDHAGHDVFIAGATFRTRQRSKETAAFAKSLWIDIDVGADKLHLTDVDAVEALSKSCKTLSLKRPTIVHSGHGLHCWFQLDRDVEPEEWKALATGLKRAVAATGLQADPSRTADIASFLRPVGTFNRKRAPAPVRMLRTGAAQAVGTLTQLLASYGPAQDPLSLLGDPPSYISLFAANDDLAGERRQVSIAEPIADRCAVMAEFRDTGGVVEEPLWRAGLGLLAHTQNGRQVAHEWSSGDPRYDAAQTDRKFDDVSEYPPTLCATFESHRPQTCAVCTHKGAIKTPWTLGLLRPETKEPTAILAADIEAYRLSNFPRVNYQRRPIHSGLAYRGEVSILVAPGGVGKSTFAIAASLAVAGGVDLLDTPPGPSTPVLMINGEECQGEILLKFQAACAHHQLTAHPEDMFVVGSEGADPFQFVQIDRTTGRERLNDGAFQSLAMMIANTRAQLVVIDPLTAFIAAGANDNGLMAALMRRLKNTAQEADCGILLVAHTRKGARVSEDGAEITAGAGALTNLARSVLTVSRPTQRTLDAAGVTPGYGADVRELVDLKGNLRARGAPVLFSIATQMMPSVHADFPGRQAVGVAAAFRPPAIASVIPDTTLRTALEILALGKLVGGRSVPYGPNHQSQGRFFATALRSILPADLAKCSDVQARRHAEAVLARLEGRNWVKTEDHKIGRNARQGLTVCWSQTPWAGEVIAGDFQC